MSNKEHDAHGRWRNKTVAFRASPEEAELINLRAALSGLSKQQHHIRALTEQRYTVKATTRTLRAIKTEIGPIVTELRRIRRAGDMPVELIEKLDVIADFVGSFEPQESPVDAADAIIKNMKAGSTPRQSDPAGPSETPNE